MLNSTERTGLPQGEDGRAYYHTSRIGCAAYDCDMSIVFVVF